VIDTPISYCCPDKDKEKGRVAGPKTRKARVVHAIVLSDMLLLVNKKGDQHELLMEVCGATGSGSTANPPFLRLCSARRELFVGRGSPLTASLCIFSPFL
jgi:hypothetical protein